MKHLYIKTMDPETELVYSANEVLLTNDSLRFMNMVTKKEEIMNLDGIKSLKIVPVCSHKPSKDPVKVFISQPMKGKSKEEILAEREKAIKTLKRTMEYQDVDVINSYLDYEDSPLKKIANSIGMLADAKVAVFIGKWYEARGCSIEHQCAIEYGIKSIYMK